MEVAGMTKKMICIILCAFGRLYCRIVVCMRYRATIYGLVLQNEGERIPADS